LGHSSRAHLDPNSVFQHAEKFSEVGNKNPGLIFFYHLQFIGNSSQCVFLVGKVHSAEVRKREKGDQVDQVGNSELAEMTQALENATANLSSTSVTEPGLMQLPELADQVGASSFVG
jgi:hypothetical protein